MLIRIGFEIVVECPQPTPVLAALYPHPAAERRTIGSDRIHTEPPATVRDHTDPFTNRLTRLELPAGTTRLWSDSIVEDSGQPDLVNPQARQHDIMDLPAETLTYLLASRYCESDELIGPAWELFGTTEPGWTRAQAIADWVHAHVHFDYRFGRPTKTATDVFREGTGVCRDFAHLFIALCRAVNIPARYASGYLGDIGVPPAGPGDFSAWAEVFLDGRWYTMDARHNTPRIGRIVMVRGRDAADVAMMTAFGEHRLRYFRVWTDEADPTLDEAAHLESLKHRPPGEALVYPDAAGMSAG